MNQQPENLLETDRLEDVLDEPGPPNPVVVIQYRSRVIPWLILMLFLAVVPMLGLLVHYRREAARSAPRRSRQGASWSVARGGAGREPCTAVPGGRSAGGGGDESGFRGRRRHADRPGLGGFRAGDGAASGRRGAPAIPAAGSGQVPRSAPREGRSDSGDGCCRSPGGSTPTARPRPASLGPAVRVGDPGRRRGERPRGRLPVRSPAGRGRGGRGPGPGGRRHRPRRRGCDRRSSARRRRDGQPGGPRRRRGRPALALGRGDRAADPGGGRQEAARGRPAAGASRRRTSEHSGRTIADSSWTSCGGSSRPPASKQGRRSKNSR